MNPKASIACVLAAAVALGALLPFPAAEAAERAGGPAAGGAALFGGIKNPTPEDAVRVIDEATRKTASDLTDKLAGGYVEFLRNASKALDDRKIYAPAYREALLAKQEAAVINGLLKSYDSFAASTKAAWRQKAPGALWTVSNALDGERDRLVDFFIEDAGLIIKAARSVQASRRAPRPPADSGVRAIRAQVEAAAEADTASDFKRSLYRAAAISDAEVQRVIRSRVRKLAAALTAKMADNYLKVRVNIEAVLDDKKITDAAARASATRTKSEEARGAMMREYDAFAAKTSAAFDGAPAPVSRAVADALKVERAKIGALLAAVR